MAVFSLSLPDYRNARPRSSPLSSPVLLADWDARDEWGCGEGVGAAGWGRNRKCSGEREDKKLGPHLVSAPGHVR